LHPFSISRVLLCLLHLAGLFLFTENPFLWSFESGLFVLRVSYCRFPHLLPLGFPAARLPSHPSPPPGKLIPSGRPLSKTLWFIYFPDVTVSIPLVSTYLNSSPFLCEFFFFGASSPRLSGCSFPFNVKVPLPRFPPFPSFCRLRTSMRISSAPFENFFFNLVSCKGLYPRPLPTPSFLLHVWDQLIWVSCALVFAL